MNIVKSVCYLLIALSIALASYTYYHNARYITHFSGVNRMVFKDTWTGDIWITHDNNYFERGLDNEE